MKLKLISYTILLVGLLGCRSESEVIETSVSNKKIL